MIKFLRSNKQWKPYLKFLSPKLPRILLRVVNNLNHNVSGDLTYFCTIPQSSLNKQFHPIFDQIKNFLFKAIFSEQTKLWICFCNSKVEWWHVFRARGVSVYNLEDRRWQLSPKSRNVQMQVNSRFFPPRKLITL